MHLADEYLQAPPRQTRHASQHHSTSTTPQNQRPSKGLADAEGILEHNLFVCRDVRCGPRVAFFLLHAYAI